MGDRRTGDGRREDGNRELHRSPLTAYRSPFFRPPALGVRPGNSRADRCRGSGRGCPARVVRAALPFVPGSARGASRRMPAPFPTVLARTSVSPSSSAFSLLSVSRSYRDFHMVRQKSDRMDHHIPYALVGERLQVCANIRLEPRNVRWSTAALIDRDPRKGRRPPPPRVDWPPAAGLVPAGVGHGPRDAVGGKNDPHHRAAAAGN
jgi:hypothetical protein